MSNIPVYTCRLWLPKQYFQLSHSISSTIPGGQSSFSYQQYSFFVQILNYELLILFWWFKGTVCVMLSDTPCKDANADSQQYLWTLYWKNGKYCCLTVIISDYTRIDYQ